MNGIIKDFHVLQTKGGAVAFHAPSFRFFQLEEPVADVVSRVEQQGSASAGLDPGELEMARSVLSTSIPQGMQLKDNLLGKQDKISGFYLFVSQKCNLACSYCYGDGGEYRKSKMVMDETTADNFIDKFITGDSPSYMINFFGGEPFLNFPLMKKVVSECKRKAAERGFSVVFNVTTNGTVWTDAIRRFVADEIGTVTVSLDGPKDINDRQRLAKGSFSPFDKTVKTINDLDEIKPHRYLVRTILTKNSHRRVADIHKYNSALAKTGEVGLSTADVESGTDIALSDEEHQSLVNELIQLNSESLRSILNDSGWKLNEYTSGFCEQIFFKKYRADPCNAGRTVVAIAADGDIYPCHRFVGYEDFRVGNVNDDSPLNGTYGRIRTSFAETPVDANAWCKDCWARYLCGGSCYTISYLREGDVFKPPARYCRLKKTVYDSLLSEFVGIMADPEKKGVFMTNMERLFRRSEEAV